MITIPVTPVSKPRQTKSDRWKKRPCVMRYRAFADQVRLAEKLSQQDFKKILLEGACIVFVIPMPNSWSKKKKAKMYGLHHQQKRNDIDNLVKALMDALLEEDGEVHTVCAKKVWGNVGCIKFWPMDYKQFER